MGIENLKISIIAPPHFQALNPNCKNTGSIENHACLLAQALAGRGHEVTLFAAEDSNCHNRNVKLKSVFRSPKNYYALTPDEVRRKEEIHVIEARKELSKDPNAVISNHTMTGIRIIGNSPDDKRAVSTIWWPITDRRVRPYLDETKHHNLIAISKHQIANLPNSKFIERIPPGVDIDDWPYTPNKEEFLLFVGKIMPQKGVDLAIQAALRMGKKLIIAGRIISERYPEYFEESIKPYLGRQIEYVGEVSGQKKIHLFSKAQSFISPGRWAEPFGIVFIEAQACGTPAIAWNPGSSNDSIIHGKTGFIIDAKNDSQAIHELTQAIEKIDTINPLDCRKNVEDHFTIERTAIRYEKVLTSIKNK